MKINFLITLLFFSIFSFGQTFGVMTSDVNSRKSPSTAGEILRIIKKGQIVEILQSKGNWSFVNDISVNKKGWVSKKYISQKIATLTTDANSRKSPDGEILRVIKKGQIVEIIQKKGKWVFVRDMSVNKKGWVSNNLLSSKFSGNLNEKKDNQNLINNVIVTDQKNNNIISESISNDENIIEKRLTEMGILWKWRNFKKGIRSKIFIPDIITFTSTVNSYMGTPYQRGGTSRTGIDCSGLIYRGLKSVGYQGERLNAQMLAQSGTLIANKNSLRKGDLVCFTNTTGANKLVHHIAIYVGNNQFLHAPSKGKKVSLANINDPYYWGERFIFGVRYTN